MGMSNRVPIVLAALNGLMAVALGAFAAHAVSAPDAKELLRTGAGYQLAHAAAGLAAAPRSALASLLMGAGALVFALSLDALAAGAPHATGAVTPFGGLAMIGGWLVLLVTAFRARADQP